MAYTKTHNNIDICLFFIQRLRLKDRITHIGSNSSAPVINSYFYFRYLSGFATDSEQLGNELTDAFKKLNVVFVVGGLGFDDEKGIKSIISRALCETPANDCKKLKNENGDDGYVVRAANQILILLPDEPEQIESIMQGPLRKYIMANSVMQ